MKPSSDDLTLGFLPGGRPLTFRAKPQGQNAHVHVLGVSGGGKSCFLAGVQYQALRLWPDSSVVTFVVKEADADFQLDALAVLGPRVGMAPRDALVIHPASDHGIRMNPCFAFPDKPVEQRAAVLADSLKARFEGVRERMHALLTNASRAAMEIEGGASLLDVARLMRVPEYGAVMARHVKSPEVREFLVSTLPTEAESSRFALAARLERILMPPGVRAALCSRGCIAGEELLAGQRLCLVILAGGELGYTGPIGFQGDICFLITAGAILSRRVTPKSRPVILIVDEWVHMAASLADDFERCLVLGRSSHVGIWLANQVEAQVTACSQKLAASLAGNVALRIHFSPQREDLKAALSVAPISGHRQSRELPDVTLTRAEEREAWIEAVCKLPPRHMAVHDHIHGRFHVARTASLPVAEIARRAREIPEEERAAWRRGRLGVPLGELLAEAQLRFPPGVIDVRSKPPANSDDEVSEEAPAARLPRRRRPKLELSLP